MIYNYLQRFDAGTDDTNISPNMIYNSKYGSDPNMDSDVANSNAYYDIAQYDQQNQNQARMQAEQEAESANSIQKYNMLFQQLIDQNNKLKQQNQDIKTNAVKQNPYYKIDRGDTLSKIAAKHNITVEQLAKLNGIRDINDIKLGQHLRFSDNVSNRYNAKQKSRQQTRISNIYGKDFKKLKYTGRDKQGNDTYYDRSINKTVTGSNEPGVMFNVK